MSSLKEIEWIFFDMGSTLVDEREADLHRIKEMTAGTDITIEAYREKRLELIRQGQNDYAAIAYYGMTKTPWHSEDEIPYSDAIPVLEELKSKGYRLGIIANQPLGSEQRLAKWGLLPYFDVVAPSAELGVAKPDPAIFEWALTKAGCKAQNTVFVGDRLENDVAPANRLGMHSIRILRGLGAYHEPQSNDEIPEYTIRSLSELTDLL